MLQEWSRPILNLLPEETAAEIETGVEVEAAGIEAGVEQSAAMYRPRSPLVLGTTSGANASTGRATDVQVQALRQWPLWKYVQVANELPVPPPRNVPPQKLEVTITKATGLKHMGMSGDSLSCVCQVGASKFTTRPIEQSLEPKWGDSRLFDHYAWGDSLDFTVSDESGQGVKTEGKVTLKWEYFLPDGCEAELPISGCHDAVLHVRIVPARV
jgi:hypothetical protein